MKVVLTNDDGIDAPGLAALVAIISEIAVPVVVAPRIEQSGAAHRVTARSPIPFRQTGENRYWVDASPADCARVALKHLVPDAGWLISGINAGANLGSDVYNSGTVAAAREAAILGCRSIAVSQYIAKGHAVDWTVTAAHAAPILRMLISGRLEAGTFWNVNLPHPLPRDPVVPYRFCDLDTHPHAYTYRVEAGQLIYQGTIHERPRAPGRDVAVCFDDGAAAVTRIPIGTCALNERSSKD
ncbi:5'/3'-nucleotidase SurE [Desulfococcus multivorans]|nr:5'/3'-nucleotidase SurE [Desulfococcus multivorans]